MQSAETGDPIQRPLVYDYQDDPAVTANSTEFLFGPDLLVAPVVDPGAVIPTAPVTQSSMFYAPEEITLTAYLPTRAGTTVSRLYEDDGLTDAFVAGRYLRTTIALTRAGSRLELKASLDGAGHGECTRRSFRLVFVGAPIRSRTLRNSGQAFETTYTL